MLEYLNRISVLEKSQRRANIMKILDELETPYAVYHGTFNNKWVNNVAVPFHNGGKRFVLSAHYDNVDNSTGANDNAAACVVLLELIRSHRDLLKKYPLELVFFDDEEHGRSGSQLYIKDNPGKIMGMVNMDLIGVGDLISCGPENNAAHTIFKKAMKAAQKSGKHNIRVPKMVPISDQQSFETAGIPNMVISVCPTSDFEMMEVMAQCIRSGKQLTPENIEFVPTVMSTIHNKANDKIEIVEESSMKAVTEFLTDLIENLNIKPNPVQPLT